MLADDFSGVPVSQQETEVWRKLILRPVAYVSLNHVLISFKQTWYLFLLVDGKWFEPQIVYEAVRGKTRLHDVLFIIKDFINDSGTETFGAVGRNCLNQSLSKLTPTVHIVE